MKEHKPDEAGNQGRHAWIDQQRRTKILIETDSDEEQSGKD